MVTDVRVDPFTDDQTHLHEQVRALVLEFSARHYTTFEAAGVRAGTSAPAWGLEDRLARVEQTYTERVQQLAVLTHRCAQLEAEVAVLRQAASMRGGGDSGPGLARGLRTAVVRLGRLVSRG